ncbi:MAG: peptidoglycan recognition family protein, partial [Caldilineaceae bacterium]|nr:peptidoglycan recognition family protein [Caldilineaceae bacterium]
RTEPPDSSVTGQGGGGIDAPPIVDRVGTIPKHPVLDFPTRQLSAIRQIVVHHSGFPSHVTPHAMAESLVLDQLAMDGTEPGLPYHFFVQVDGTVEQIHDLSVACHSTQEGHDRIVAVCLAGTFSQGINPTPLQLEHAGHLIAWLLQTCYLSEADIVGHRDVDPFEEVCPGEEWSSGNNWSQTLRYHISRHLSGNPADAVPVS